MRLPDFLLLLPHPSLPDLCKKYLTESSKSPGLVANIRLPESLFKYTPWETVASAAANKTAVDVFFIYKYEQVFGNGLLIPFYRTDIVID